MKYLIFILTKWLGLLWEVCRLQEGRTKKSLKNIAYSLSNQILNLILQFITRTVFIHYLGAELLGINGLFTDVLGLLSMADLGLNVAMVYSFYKPLAENNKIRIAALTQFYKRVYSVITIVVSTIGICIIPVLPYLINLERDVPNIGKYYLLSLLNIVFSYVGIYKTSVLTADQNNYIITRITMITNLAKMILQIFAVVVFRSFMAYLIIGPFVILVNNICASKYASKIYPFINDKTELPSNEKKDILKNILSVFVYKVSNVLLTATDNIIISIIIGTVVVGIYSNYLLVQSKIVLIYSLIFSSVTASVGNLIVTGTPLKKYQVFKCEQSISFAASVVIVPCYICLINPLINVWLGANYIFEFSTVIFIGLNLYMSCVLQPLWSFREATGLYNKTKWIMVACAILNLILSVVLGKIMGINGIIFASSISRLITYVWYEPNLLFTTYFNIKPAQYFVEILANIVLVCGVTCICILITRNMLQNSIIDFLVLLLLVGTVSLIFSIVFYFKSEGVKMLIERFCKKQID